MKIIWSPLAISRASGIAEYISQDNPDAAVKWIERIFEKIRQLKKYPESGRILPELEMEDIRELIYGNYRIVYRIKQGTIIIMTIRHSRQILPEDETK